MLWLADVLLQATTGGLHRTVMTAAAVVFATEMTVGVLHGT